jgi:hypothetical protein
VKSQFPKLFSVDAKELEAWLSLLALAPTRMTTVDFQKQIAYLGETPCANRAKTALGAGSGEKVENRFPTIEV